MLYTYIYTYTHIEGINEIESMPTPQGTNLLLPTSNHAKGGRDSEYMWVGIIERESTHPPKELTHALVTTYLCEVALCTIGHPQDLPMAKTKDKLLIQSIDLLNSMPP